MQIEWLVTGSFSIAIQILWKLLFALILILKKWALQYFADCSGAVIVCANCCCDLIAYNWIRATQIVPSNFSCKENIVEEIGPSEPSH